MSEIDFDDIDIVNKVETLDVKSVDSLPFGVVRLDNAGVVRIFNTTEAEFSGYGARPKTGKNFLHRYRALHEYA